MTTHHIGVLALQGAFAEHLSLLSRAAASHPSHTFTFAQVRTPADLSACSALIIPGGESTTMALVAARSGLIEPLRHFIKVDRRPVWGTCAGLILLSEAADTDTAKTGGQELLGGLDVRVRRNHFGRQAQSFVAPLRLKMLAADEERPFPGIFIRAPVVEEVLAPTGSERTQIVDGEEGVTAPQRGEGWTGEVEVLGRLDADEGEHGRVVAVRQGNVFGTSFHPELTGDERVHIWWLGEVMSWVADRGKKEER